MRLSVALEDEELRLLAGRSRSKWPSESQCGIAGHR
jgi:hypothetical protein